MQKNKDLRKAKINKRDEFYTQFSDIANELKHYREDFRGKVIFCNCDDPYESNFFKYFAVNFNTFGLKKLIATCYKASPVAGEQLSLFDIIDMPPQTDDKKPYKIEITEVVDLNGDGAVDLADVETLIKNKKNTLTLLEGDGDFRSAECIELLKEADIVVTNPPFSLFREYVAQLVEYDKKFIIIGNQNAITYKEIFPLLKENKMWLGYGFNRNCAHFINRYYEDTATDTDHRDGMIRVSGVMWYTNLDVKTRHEEIILFRKYIPEEYPHYDNYDAIEVSKTADIPCDYDGAMGVPITFMQKYNPEQFDILGLAASAAYNQQIVGIPFNGVKDARPLINDKNTYARVFVKKKR